MIVTPAQAGVQLKVAWIPAFAGMTNESPIANPSFPRRRESREINLAFAVLLLRFFKPPDKRWLNSRPYEILPIIRPFAAVLVVGAAGLIYFVYKFFMTL